MQKYWITAHGVTEYGFCVIKLVLDYSPTLAQVNELGSIDRETDFRAHQVSVIPL